MTDLHELLRSATTIELIDWPHQEVPATLVRAGYTVVAPRHPPEEGKTPFVLHEVGPLPAADPGTSLPLADGWHLSFPPLEALPSAIDIVSTYRPAEEQPAIVEEAVRLGARAVWVEPGEPTSAAAKEIAEAAGVAFIEGTSIADEVRSLAAGS